MEELATYGVQKKNTAFMAADPSAIAAAEAAKAAIFAGYQMALLKPRNEMDARDNILRACGRTDMAKRVEYAKPVGGKKIRGPSVRFAEVALNYWGNVTTQSFILYEDEMVRRIRVSCVDMENNITHSRDYTLQKIIERRSKAGRENDVIGERVNSYGDKVYILKATEEEMATKEAAWISKGKRNEGLRLIPSDIIDEALDVARRTIAEGIKKDPEGEKKRILDSFSSIGVKPSEIEKYLGHTISTVSPAELIDLRSVFQTIRDGEATWADYIAQTAGEDLKAKTMDMAARLKERLNGKREPHTKDPTATGNPPIEVPSHIWARNNWIKLRGTGYTTFVHKNLDTLHEAPQEIIDEAMAKWGNLYDTPCPFNAAGRPVEQVVETDPEPQEPDVDEEVDALLSCVKYRDGDTFYNLVDLLRRSELAREIWRKDVMTRNKDVVTEEDLGKVYRYMVKHSGEAF